MAEVPPDVLQQKPGPNALRTLVHKLQVALDGSRGLGSVPHFGYGAHQVPSVTHYVEDRDMCSVVEPPALHLLHEAMRGFLAELLIALTMQRPPARNPDLIRLDLR